VAIPGFAHADPSDSSTATLAVAAATPPYSCTKLGFPTSPPKKSVLCRRACTNAGSNANRYCSRVLAKYRAECLSAAAQCRTQCDSKCATVSGN